MLGYSFIIMEKVPGENTDDAIDMTKDGQEIVWEQFTTTLADIHRLDWGAAELGFLEPPEEKQGFHSVEASASAQTGRAAARSTSTCSASTNRLPPSVRPARPSFTNSAAAASAA